MSSGVYSKLTGYHNRRSIRLPGFDYARPGYYFVTICVHDHACHLFGDIIMTDSGPVLTGTIANGTVSAGAGLEPALYYNPLPKQSVHVNEFASAVQSTWDDLPGHIPGIALDAFVIMPNHVHAIIRIVGTGVEPGAGLEPAPTTTATLKRFALPEIVRQFKTFSAKRINAIRNTPGKLVWQRNYYDRVICSPKSLNRVRNYSRENPAKWAINPDKHIDGEMTELGNLL